MRNQPSLRNTRRRPRSGSIMAGIKRLNVTVFKIRKSASHLYVSRSGDLSWPFRTGVTLPRGTRNAIEFSHTFSRPKNVPDSRFHILDEHVSHGLILLSLRCRIQGQDPQPCGHFRPLIDQPRHRTLQIDIRCRAIRLPALQNEIPPQGRIDVSFEVDELVRLLDRPGS